MVRPKLHLRPWMAFGLGLLGWASIGLALVLDLKGAQYPILVSPIFPMIAALAWGVRGAFYAGIGSFWFLIPFVYWPEHGYASIAPGLWLLLWLFAQGYAADQRRKNSAWYWHPIVVQLLLVPSHLFTILWAMPMLSQLNPAPWSAEPYIIDQSMAQLFVVKRTINAFMTVALVHALLALPLLRRALFLPDGGQSSRYSWRIFLASVGFGLLLVILLNVLHHFFMGHSLSWISLRPENMFNALADTVLLTASVLLGGFISRYVEKRMAHEAQINASLELKSQELINKNEDLESLLYMVSHDVRSPLVNIRGFAMELRTLLQEPQKFYNDVDVQREVYQSLQFIDSGAQRLSAIATGALRIARLGRGELHVSVLDTKAIAHEAVQSFQFQIQETHSVVRIGEIPSCLGDRGFLLQVFSNLVDNALKYRNEGSGAILEVSGSVLGSWCVIVVRDHGQTIPEYHRTRIFEPLFRIEKHSRIPGQGLGLAIAKRLMGLQGGRIWVEPAPHGDGNRFCISLPIPNAE